MKILHLISGGDTGGAKTHVFALLRALTKKADVKIVCFMKGTFFDELQNIDVESELIEQKNRFDLSVLKRVKEIAKDGFDLIHSHGARANFLCTHLKNKLDIPIVTTIHSDYLLDFDGIYKKIVFTGLNMFALNKLDNYIAVSTNFKDMLISRGFKPNRIYTVYNGMDYSTPMEYQSKEEFAKRIGIEYNKDNVYIGLIGRHYHVKGHDIFVKACGIVAKKRKNARFLIAGDGDLRNELIHIAKEQKIEDKLIFTGFLKDIYSFINFIDINTLTSRSESFPYVLMEGARMKKPTVSSRVGGIPDLIIDGKTGLLFESENCEELAEKLIQLIDSKDERNRLGESLYDFATSTFSSENLANTHIDIYNSIMKKHKDKKEYDIVISGYYGFDNSGDDALLFAIIESLKKYIKDVRIAVLSEKPKDTERIYKVDSNKRFNLFSVSKVLKKSKMLINGGGSLLQDETSSLSLYYYLWVVNRAKRLNLKTYFYANGIGPVKKRNARLVSRVANKVDLITLRDEMSLNELLRLNVTIPETKVTADPAVILESSDKKRVLEIFKSEGIVYGEKYLGISLRAWDSNDINIESKIAAVADYAFESYGIKTVLIPMRHSIDMHICENVLSLIKHKAHILKNRYNVFDTVAITREMYIVMGMRLHTLVYAAGGGVPLIGLIYDPKNKGFLDYIEQNRMVDVKDIDVAKLKAYIDEISKNYNDIQASIKSRQQKLIALADINGKYAADLLNENL